MKKIKINISYQGKIRNRYRAKSIIKECIRQTLISESVTVPCEINIMITDNKGIQEMNSLHRGIDKSTDVLSFPMFDFIAGQLPESWETYMDPESGRCPLGDMAISLERAIEQAKEFGHSIRREIGYLTIHSMLHLLGYDHMDDGPQKAQMRLREEHIAAQIPNMNRTET